ncbi:hypothetical protein JOF56_006487 [Kibdelosporangium banguiense]|uniref:Uncharacterized protein n=1 Tax=Kibdelosporangium banguiense TaxID=1365924 RepID=A0ABS4TNX1_9PSEU|nr:hypothetical protein [Kibdelosporangium banguiense]
MIRTVNGLLAAHVNWKTRGSARTVPLSDSMNRFHRDRRSFGRSSGAGSGISTGPVSPLSATELGARRLRRLRNIICSKPPPGII